VFSLTNRSRRFRWNAYGQGKGEPEYWAAVVKPGTVLYEIGGATEEAARLCFNRLAHKMPVQVRFISGAHVAALVEVRAATTKRRYEQQVE